MTLYLVSFSGRLARHAATTRADLMALGATQLWNGVWVVDMDAPPETGLPNLVHTEAAFSIPLERSGAFFSIGRAAGFAARLRYFEEMVPRLCVPTAEADAASVRYCNDGKTVFADVVGRYLTLCRHATSATDLCRLMAGHGSDKGLGWHTYTPFYQALFLDRRDAVTAVFELGLGTNDEDVPSNMGPFGRPGASLRAWRDYFPNARIYGADVDRNVLFAEDRIETFFVDQADLDTFNALWRNLPDVELDLFLDDGLHSFAAAETTFRHAIGKVRKGGYYIIEDVMRSSLENYLHMVEEHGLAGMAIDIAHQANIYDNCLIVAAAR